MKRSPGRCVRRKLTLRRKLRTASRIRNIWWLYASEPTRVKWIKSSKRVHRRINRRTFKERW